MNRNGELVIVDDTRPRARALPGHLRRQLLVEGGRRRSRPATLLAEWDPFAIAVLTEVGGVVKFEDIIEGVTMNETLDEVTGLSPQDRSSSRRTRRPVRASPSRDAKGERQDLLAPGSSAQLPPAGRARSSPSTTATRSTPGDVIAKIPRETTKTKDITGGLPRVAELFEARKPKDHAIIAEIDGVVSFGKDTKGKRKLIITPEVNGELRTDLAKEYLIPKGKHISVHAGDRVQGRRAADGRPGQPARHPQGAGREGARGATWWTRCRRSTDSRA